MITELSRKREALSKEVEQLVKKLSRSRDDEERRSHRRGAASDAGGGLERIPLEREESKKTTDEQEIQRTEDGAEAEANRRKVRVIEKQTQVLGRVKKEV